MAIGNTFGATALSSYAGFWFSFAITLTPGFDILSKYKGTDFYTAFGFFLFVCLVIIRTIVTITL